MSLDCLDYAPGLTFARPQQSLWLPYMIVTDLGVLAFANATGGLSTKILPSSDVVWKGEEELCFVFFEVCVCGFGEKGTDLFSLCLLHVGASVF